MPELLLSSAPVQKLAPSALDNRSKDKPLSGISNGLDTANTSENKGGKFNNILSSMLGYADSEKLEQVNKNDSEELGLALDGVMIQLEKLDIDPEMLTGIKDFIDGQDFSSFSLGSLNEGLSLPDFLSELGAMINSILNQVDEDTGIPLSEALGTETDAIESAFLQLNMLISKIANRSEGGAQASGNSLLGFSFESGKGKNGQWQQYDPQQMSQPENGSKLPLDTQSQGLISERLVSETDQSFKAQMGQLVAGNNLDAAELVDSLSEAMLGAKLDAKDNTQSKFSDIQLRTPNEALKQYSTTLSTPVNSEQWSDDLSQKILWFAGRNIQTAEMHLNPAELGPIDVKIHVQNDVATVTFNVNNASVRDLLESNVVRLREMMEANGVNVGDVNVGSDTREQSQQSNSDSSEKGFSQSGHDSGESGELVMTEKEVTIKQANLVDYFV
tara:strand:- start:11345 stop:12676 length:1332 start_codon:yes stop_codon:yes gene_type:complete